MDHQPQSLSQKLIAKSDVRAEKLIALLRMALSSMLFFGVVFVLTQAEASGLHARMFELYSLLAGATCYFLLGLINLYNATEERLKPWKIWCFNFAEVLLVAIQLYVDISDAETPSTLAFASPVLLLAALVISIQVLRFQFRLHVASTLLLLVLCGLILFHNPGWNAELSPKAEHELALLYTIPPNVIRMVMLTAMAGLIAVAIHRSRRLIEEVAVETETVQNQNRFLPAEIADHMNDAALRSLRDGEERVICALFVDVRNFTKLSEQIGPRETARFLNSFRSVIMDAAERHDGAVDKFIGDGALILFGLRKAVRDACRDALAAADQISDASGAWMRPTKTGDQNIAIAIGLHVGPAMICAIGDDRRLEFTAVGNTINLAARLEGLAKENNWLMAVSAATVEMAGIERHDFQREAAVVLKGTDEPLKIFSINQPS